MIYIFANLSLASIALLVTGYPLFSEIWPRLYLSISFKYMNALASA